MLNNYKKTNVNVALEKSINVKNTVEIYKAASTKSFKYKNMLNN